MTGDLSDWTRMSGHLQHSFKNTHYKQRGT